jgi:hypothetical protein
MKIKALFEPHGASTSVLSGECINCHAISRPRQISYSAALIGACANCAISSDLSASSFRPARIIMLAVSIVLEKGSVTGTWMVSEGPREDPAQAEDVTFRH